MDDIFNCICHLDSNHREIGCFFKYVVFLLKRFVSYLSILESNDKEIQTEMLKNEVWMQIAAEYDGYYTGERYKWTLKAPVQQYSTPFLKHDILISIDFVADGKCEDGCVLKMLQKSAENQLKILTRYFSSSIDQN